MDEQLPKFDPLAHCIKCGNSIPEPVKIPEPSPSSPGSSAGPKKPGQVAQPKAPVKKESAAAPPLPTGPGFALPPQAAPPKVDYCNGLECPWGEETEGLGEHMHQFCEVCGFEWLSLPLG